MMYIDILAFSQTRMYIMHIYKVGVLPKPVLRAIHITTLETITMAQQASPPPRT